MNRRGAIVSAAGLAAVAAAAVAIVSASSSSFDWNAAYQAAKPGDVVSVPAGSYPDVVLGYRADLANLSPGCSPQSPGQCVKFNVSGGVTVGKLEIHGSSVYVAGNGQLNATGYIDTEADSATNHPDHVYVADAHSTSFGVFNADTVTFKNLDVGPATVSTGCATREGNGFENKIGSAGGVVYSPRNVVLDGLRIHDQNGDSGRINSDCHDGGFFLAGAQGLTVRNTVFQGNVVYNVQIQSINGAPIQNVTFDNDSFGCPVNWLYQNNNPLACDGQSSIQFDGTYPGVTITNSSFAEGVGAKGWGCYAGTCDYSGDTFSGNQLLAQSVTAPPLSGTTPPPPPPPPTTTTTGTTTPITTAVPPPSVKALIDQAVTLLKLTTVGYKGHPASWYANTTTNWYQGLQKLAQARAAAP